MLSSEINQEYILLAYVFIQAITHLRKILKVNNNNYHKSAKNEKLLDC